MAQDSIEQNEQYSNTQFCINCALLPSHEKRWNLANWQSSVNDIFLVTLRHINAELARYIASYNTIELSILFTNDSEIQKLNNEWRGRNKPTNVLSFPALEFTSTTDAQPQIDINATDYSIPLHVGDIAISYDTIALEAQKYGIEFEERVTHMLIHGLLHLLGYNHETDMECEKMEKLETIIMKALDFSDPWFD